MNQLFNGIGVGFGVLFLLLIAAVIFLLFLTVSLILRLNRLTVRMRSFMKGKDARSLEEEIEGRLADLDQMNNRQSANQTDISNIRRKFRRTLNHYGIVKYDAFDDVGGKLSFVLAMLDDENTGFVLDAIHSRDNCFVYLKEIVKGESYIMLSEEEISALKQAAGTEETETE
jgi:hypothetical protein